MCLDAQQMDLDPSTSEREQVMMQCMIITHWHR